MCSNHTSGDINNNLGPGSLAGSKALDPNNCRQLTLLLHDPCMEVQTVHGNELCQAISSTHTVNVVHLT